MAAMSIIIVMLFLLIDMLIFDYQSFFDNFFEVEVSEDAVTSLVVFVAYFALYLLLAESDEVEAGRRDDCRQLGARTGSCKSVSSSASTVRRGLPFLHDAVVMHVICAVLLCTKFGETAAGCETESVSRGQTVHKSSFAVADRTSRSSVFIDAACFSSMLRDVLMSDNWIHCDESLTHGGKKSNRARTVVSEPSPSLFVDGTAFKSALRNVLVSGKLAELGTDPLHGYKSSLLTPPAMYIVVRPVIAYPVFCFFGARGSPTARYGDSHGACGDSCLSARQSTSATDVARRDGITAERVSQAIRCLMTCRPQSVHRLDVSGDEVAEHCRPSSSCVLVPRNFIQLDEDKPVFARRGLGWRVVPVVQQTATRRDVTAPSSLTLSPSHALVSGIESYWRQTLLQNKTVLRSLLHSQSRVTVAAATQSEGQLMVRRQRAVRLSTISVSVRLSSSVPTFTADIRLLPGLAERLAQFLSCPVSLDAELVGRGRVRRTSFPPPVSQSLVSVSVPQLALIPAQESASQSALASSNAAGDGEQLSVGKKTNDDCVPEYSPSIEWSGVIDVDELTRSFLLVNRGIAQTSTNRVQLDEAAVERRWEEEVEPLLRRVVITADGFTEVPSSPSAPAATDVVDADDPWPSSSLLYQPHRVTPYHWPGDPIPVDPTASVTSDPVIPWNKKELALFGIFDHVNLRKDVIQNTQELVDEPPAIELVRGEYVHRKRLEAERHPPRYFGHSSTESVHALYDDSGNDNIAKYKVMRDHRVLPNELWTLRQRTSPTVKGPGSPGRPLLKKAGKRSASSRRRTALQPAAGSSEVPVPSTSAATSRVSSSSRSRRHRRLAPAELGQDSSSTATFDPVTDQQAKCSVPMNNTRRGSSRKSRKDCKKSSEYEPRWFRRIHKNTECKSILDASAESLIEARRQAPRRRWWEFLRREKVTTHDVVTSNKSWSTFYVTWEDIVAEEWSKNDTDVSEREPQAEPSGKQAEYAVVTEQGSQQSEAENLGLMNGSEQPRSTMTEGAEKPVKQRWWKRLRQKKTTSDACSKNEFPDKELMPGRSDDIGEWAAGDANVKRKHGSKEELPVEKKSEHTPVSSEAALSHRRRWFKLPQLRKKS